MRSRTILLILAIACAAPVFPAGGWVSLFDGKTMKGWQARPTFDPASTGDWTVKDGALLCGGTTPSWLSTDQQFSDFRLRLEFRGSATVNSAVFIRSQKEGEPHVTGYEVQIWDYQPAGYLTGSLVGAVKAAPARILAGAWNTFDITARGTRFIVVLNGTTILDANDSRHRAGVVGFQCQKGQRIEFRNIEIQSLKK